jgi:hypothetical protein
MISIYFPDDERVVQGFDASDALMSLAKMQWEQPMTIERLKELLAERALGWNGAEVDSDLPDDQFLEALGKTGMVFVTSDPDPFSIPQ